MVSVVHHPGGMGREGIEVYITLENDEARHKLLSFFLDPQGHAIDIRGSANPVLRPQHIYNHGLKNYDSGIIKRPT